MIIHTELGVIVLFVDYLRSLTIRVHILFDDEGVWSVSAQLIATGRHRSGTALLRQASVGISEVFNAVGPNGYSGSRCS